MQTKQGGKGFQFGQSANVLDSGRIIKKCFKGKHKIRMLYSRSLPAPSPK
jgi:hypothetical protein